MIFIRAGTRASHVLGCWSYQLSATTLTPWHSRMDLTRSFLTINKIQAFIGPCLRSSQDNATTSWLTFSSEVIAVNISRPSGGCHSTTTNWWVECPDKVSPAQCLPANCLEMQNCSLASQIYRSLTVSLIFTGISSLSPTLGDSVSLQSAWFLLKLSSAKKPNVWCEVWRFFIKFLSVYISDALLVLNVSGPEWHYYHYNTT